MGNVQGVCPGVWERPGGFISHAMYLEFQRLTRAELECGGCPEAPRGTDSGWGWVLLWLAPGPCCYITALSTSASFPTLE